MAGCEKCWSDAKLSVPDGAAVREYYRLLVRREDDPCTPEEQCGELHVVCVKDDIGPRCRCGKVRQEPSHE